MGTGIVSILLNTLPYDGAWLYWISIVIFVLNVALFSAACVITMLRYILYPDIFMAMIRHPVQSMFIGTFPMGFATIINMFCFVCVPSWGEWTKNVAWGMWIFDAVISVMTALSLPALLYAAVLQALFFKQFLRSDISSPADHSLQNDAHARGAAVVHDSRLAVAHRQLRRRRRLRGHRRRCARRPAACAVDHHRQLRPLGDRHPHGIDGDGYLLPAAHAAQIASESDDRERLSASGSSWSGWFWVSQSQPKEICRGVSLSNTSYIQNHEAWSRRRGHIPPDTYPLR